MWTKIKDWIQKILPQKTDFDSQRMVFRTTENHLAHIIKLKLEEEGIGVLLIDKKDSSYNNFGALELYVKAEDVVRAKFLIDKPYE
ncbi:MAG: DUF2007 domain-containing protein [Brumimicrobium sp.]